MTHRAVLTRPSGRFILGYHRQGVEAGSGCLLAIPVLVGTRLRWQLRRDRRWNVELSVARPAGSGSASAPDRVVSESYDSKRRARRRVRQLRAEIAAGSHDDLLRH